MFTNFYQKSFYPLVELCIYPETLSIVSIIFNISITKIYRNGRWHKVKTSHIIKKDSHFVKKSAEK